MPIFMKYIEMLQMPHNKSNPAASHQPIQSIRVQSKFLKFIAILNCYQPYLRLLNSYCRLRFLPGSELRGYVRGWVRSAQKELRALAGRIYSCLLNKISGKKEIGRVLAKGIKYAAPALGMEDQAINVKGLESAGYDPRVLKGMGLSYGTSPRGACHLRTTFYKPELAKMIDPDQIEGKAEMLVDWEDRLIIFDCLVLCRFFRDFYQWE